MFVMLAFTAGRWFVLAVAGVIFDAVPSAELALIVFPAISVTRYLLSLDDAAPVSPVAAASRVTDQVLAGKLVDRVTCSRSSDVLRGPLFRPFYFVVWVGEVDPAPDATGAEA